MTEKNLIVDHTLLSYEGLFDLAELYRLIESWFYEKGWDKHERMNQEQITAEGKQIRIVLEPFKNITDYFKLIMKIKINFNNVTDVEIEHEGQKKKLQQGEVKMVFDGYILSDRQGRWNDKPLWWFLSIIFHKYIFKGQYTKAELWLKSDVEDVYQRVKSFLNVYRYH
ncbi:hypothetical protein GOV03_00015 [Candidatus Woesearchaeota archaeon]|nr:hypothetical protein [Candidatus Woesearchaeota archaeon]